MARAVPARGRETFNRGRGDEMDERRRHDVSHQSAWDRRTHVERRVSLRAEFHKQILDFPSQFGDEPGALDVSFPDAVIVALAGELV